MAYPTLQLSLAEIEAIEKASTVSYHNGGDRLDSQEYLMVQAVCDRWWARYTPDEEPYVEPVIEPRKKHKTHKWEGTD